MFTLKRSLLALLLTPVALGIALPRTASAAPAHRPIALLTTQTGQTIQVTGSHFTPSAKVTIVLLNTRTWQVLSTGSSKAEAAIYPCPLEVDAICGRRNPNAGRLYFQTTLQHRVSSSALAVIYRSRNHVGFSYVQGP
jgi:hypothetical protein